MCSNFLLVTITLHLRSHSMIYRMSSFLQQLSIPKSSVNNTPTNLVDFEVSTAGLSVTDPQKRLFSRKMFGIKYITYVVRIRYILCFVQIPLVTPRLSFFIFAEFFSISLLTLYLQERYNINLEPQKVS